ncbi:MAG: hypothetical protein Q8P61_02015 [Candidatus Nanopelagicales bacterium]|nr:hypothetical protein [Candidatus Nanopelagicales bacterium]
MAAIAVAVTTVAATPAMGAAPPPAGEIDAGSTPITRIAANPVPFAADSPFNQLIGPDTLVDPRSSTMVRSLVRSARQGFVVARRRWSVPVYFANASTPRRKVRLTARWRAARALHGVPIPRGARPDPEDDGSIAIVDRSTGCEYDFWQFKQKRGRWTASWGNSTRTDGTGVYPNGLSARASGFALTAGLLWPEDLAGNSIEHALAFSYDFTKAGGPVAPATETDGVTRGRTAIPIGARVRLDPTLDLNTLNLNRYQMMIAQALQRYGMILVDSGGGISVYARGPRGAPRQAWKGLLPRSTYPPLDAIPVHRLQVMNTGPQIRDPDIHIVPSGCGRFTGVRQ